MNRPLRRCVFAAGILLGCALLSATTVAKFSATDLVAQSDAIVSGTVIRTWAEWDTAHKFIWTRAEVRVQAQHKGNAAKTLVVSELGGKVDGRTMLIAGSVIYTPGEQVFVFLKDYPGVGYRTLGWGQGKYVVDQAGILHADQAVNAIEIVDLKTGKRVGSLDTFDGIDEASARSKASGRARAGVAK